MNTWIFFNHKLSSVPAFRSSKIFSEKNSGWSRWQDREDKEGRREKRSLSYYVEWGGARKVFFSWISDRESLSQALCENWGVLELEMLFPHIWWKYTVLVFVLSACSPLFSTNHSYQSHPLCTLQSLLWEKMLLFSLDHQDALFSVLLRRKTSLF